MKSGFTRSLYAVSCAVTILFSTGCNDQKAVMQHSDITVITDSLVALQLPAVIKKNEEDLSYRLTIEVKQKADSIAAAGLKVSEKMPL